MIFTASHEGNSWQSWRDTAVGQIRFGPDRERVARELDAHYEDHRLDLERIGFPPALAEQRALAAMGDPEEGGKALDKAHTTVWNQLWLVSRALLLACAIWIAVQAVTNPDAVSGARHNVGALLEGETFYEGLSPLLDPEGANPSTDHQATEGMTFLGDAVLPEEVELGAYRIRPEKGCWWRDEAGDDWLCVAIRTEDAHFPWTAPSPMFWDDCTVAGSQTITVSSVPGQRLRGSYLHWLTVELEGEREWLELRYDRGDQPLSLWIGREAAP